MTTASVTIATIMAIRDKMLTLMTMMTTMTMVTTRKTRATIRTTTRMAAATMIRRFGRYNLVK